MIQLSEKQLQILKIAEELFSKNGFDGTSVRTIAKMANINIAMISYYFGSKEKLLETLVSYRISNFQVAIGKTIENESTYVGKIDAIIALLIKRIHEGRKIHKLVHFELSREDQKIDFSNYLKKKDENIQLFTNLIKAGQADGSFNKHVDIELIVPTVLGTYFNLYYNKKIYSEAQGLFDEESFDHYVLNNLTQHIQKTIKALLTYEA
ncbi:TetR family transcriptional regulator [Zunongwangia endophytica]|uniref:TetR family transcriptional regulator n=1 Tax=Zunongwangia endophytica TaxID=1808945 RepID=A0ABV8HCL1_9FLAO|nr:TetR family transcriptional regulator [Zunongwangia endophytica]MDN3596632.1 TetR family transcriptional regulator [Zunongwangia endophytica]